MGGGGLEGYFRGFPRWAGLNEVEKKAVSPTVLTAPGMEQNSCFSTYLALKTALYSFSESK